MQDLEPWSRVMRQPRQAIICPLSVPRCAQRRVVGRGKVYNRGSDAATQTTQQSLRGRSRYSHAAGARQPDCRGGFLGNWMKTQKMISRSSKPVSGDDPASWSIACHCASSWQRFDKMMAEVSDMNRISDREMQRRRNNIGALYDDDVDDETGIALMQRGALCVCRPAGECGTTERNGKLAVLLRPSIGRPRSCTSCIIAVC